MYITILLCLLLGGFFNRKADNLIFYGGYCTDQGQYDAKYAKDGDGNKTAAPDNWYYRFYKLKYKEAFPLSATLLVSLTDPWHRDKALSMLFLRMFGVLMFSMWLRDAWHLDWKGTTLACAIVYAIAWGFQALGFHLGNWI